MYCFEKKELVVSIMRDSYDKKHFGYESLFLFTMRLYELRVSSDRDLSPP